MRKDTRKTRETHKKTLQLIEKELILMVAREQTATFNIVVKLTFALCSLSTFSPRII